MVVLLRMNPVIPYNVLNYAMSVASISLKDFTYGCVGMLPLSAMWVYIGINLHSFAQIVSGNYQIGPIYMAASLMGGLVLAILCYLMVKASRKELSKLLEDTNAPL